MNKDKEASHLKKILKLKINQHYASYLFFPTQYLKYLHLFHLSVLEWILSIIMSQT